MKNRTILIIATLDTEGPEAFGYLLTRAYYCLHWAESRKL